MTRVSLVALALLAAACAEERALEPAVRGAEQCQLLDEAGPWSELLQQWALAYSGGSRHGRVMNLPSGQSYYITDRVDGLMLPPPPPPHHGKQPNHPNYPGAPARPYDEWQHAPPAVSKIVNRPPNPYKDKFKPSHPGPPIPVHTAPAPTSVDRVDESKQEPPKQMTDTALYLLSAIEKLAYRADFMEKRLRKIEDAVHILVAGAEAKPEPCMEEFMRVGASCYHVSTDTADWKGAKFACRRLKAQLLEINTEVERRKLTAALLADKRYKGGDYWTGGLNPGLLWIWPQSAQQIVTNGTSSDNSTALGAQGGIPGAGRCLAWLREGAGAGAGAGGAGGAAGWGYRGQDCGRALRYVCEAAPDRELLTNDILRAARLLRGPRV